VGGSVIAAFRARLPGVRLEVLLQNDRVDLLKDRIDVAIRGGALPDSSLVARRLAAVPLWLYAGSTGADGPLVAAPGDERLLRRLMPERVPAVAVVDDRVAVRDALQDGAGVGILPAFLGEPLRARGALTRVGSEPLSTIPVHALFLPEQRKDVRVRVLIEEVDHRLKALLGPQR
jgi:DNA-binding transcriptional LysR family regulator